MVQKVLAFFWERIFDMKMEEFCLVYGAHTKYGTRCKYHRQHPPFSVIFGTSGGSVE